ncbi:winged helix DNA-binding domain-containing protein, partial [bacterium]|nr:winged helix DNA-binding domain-containing protein [bacterium]
YTPRPKRIYGYYVLPVLMGERVVGRVDLKADRAAGVLRVRGAFVEDHADPVGVARGVAAESREMAAWLGLTDVSVEPKGGLAGPLAAALD